MGKGMFIVKLNPVDGLTLAGMFIACCSGILAINGQFDYAMGMLFFAMLADAFDGILARKMGTTRDFGRYLDGFVDVFDYLVAPSLFLYVWGFDSWYYSLCLVVFMMSGIVRLSVFNEVGNIEDDGELSYLGMPVFWSVLFLGFIYVLSWLTGKAILFPVIAVFLITFSVLMVYNKSFYKFKNPKTIFMVVSGTALVFFIKGFINGLVLSAGVSGSSGFLNLTGATLANHMLTALCFMLPVIVGGSLHMAAVSKDILPCLKIPVNAKLFGANKTLRGFILMPLFTVFGVSVFQKLPALWDITGNLADYNSVLAGTILGLSYVIAELPNSYLKRKMGAKPGETPEKNRLLFIFLDQMDSAMGGAIVMVLFFHTPVTTALVMLAMSPCLALGVKRILYLLKLKESYA
jgi:CDP-diacylglycerol--serine O-phosphatidyltransferase